MTISKRTLREMLACTPVVFNQFLIGIGFGWTAPMLIKLQNLNNPIMSVTQEQISWIASIHDVGKLSGPFISPFIVDRIGRKYSIVIITVMLLLIWPSQIFIHNVHLLCFIRLMFGMTVGISDVAVSIYIAENCSPEFRAVMGGIMSVIFSAGSFTELILATYLTFTNTAIVNTVISMCAFSTLYFCTETPSFLIMKEKYYEAEKNFVWLRGRIGQQERFNELKSLEKLKVIIEEEKIKQKSLKTLFSSPANVKSLFIVLSMYVISTMTGGNGIGPYAVMIFPPSTIFSSYQFTILYSVFNFASVCISPVVVSKTSRRNLLIVCYLLIGLCHTCTSSLFYLHNRNYEMVFYPWLVFASIGLFGSISAMSGPAMFVIRTEILPLSVRAIGSSTAVVTSATTAFFVAKTFLPITIRFGMETNFFIYAFMSIVMSILVYFIVPETRGKTLEEIYESLNKKNIFGVLSDVDDSLN